MTEEKVTINIIKWLKKLGWNILSYDFPQSGTGILLKPNQNIEPHKNKGSIIPDIIATKENKAVIFENKDRFFLSDFNKIQKIKKEDSYSESLSLVIDHNFIDSIYYGVGFPNKIQHIKKAEIHLNKIDFLLTVGDNQNVTSYYESEPIFQERSYYVP